MKVVILVVITVLTATAEATGCTTTHRNFANDLIDFIPNLFNGILSKGDTSVDDSDDESCDDEQAKKLTLFGKTEKHPKESIPEEFLAAFNRYKKERYDENKTCTGGLETCPLVTWKLFYESMINRDRKLQLDYTNQYVNRTPFEGDNSRYKQDNYVASPKTFLERAGDCEDFVFTKYLTLRKMGWKQEDLRFVFVHVHGPEYPHMVLAARLNSKVYILDNLHMSDSVKEDKDFPDYIPIYSFNQKFTFDLRDPK